LVTFGVGLATLGAGLAALVPASTGLAAGLAAGLTAGLAFAAQAAAAQAGLTGRVAAVRLYAALLPCADVTSIFTLVAAAWDAVTEVERIERGAEAGMQV
jgi:hypothetical protein